MVVLQVINQEVVEDVSSLHHHYGVHLAVLCGEGKRFIGRCEPVVLLCIWHVWYSVLSKGHFTLPSGAPRPKGSSTQDGTLYPCSVGRGLSGSQCGLWIQSHKQGQMDLKCWTILQFYALLSIFMKFISSQGITENYDTFKIFFFCLVLEEERWLHLIIQKLPNLQT